MDVFTKYWCSETRRLILPAGDYTLPPIRRDDFLIQAKAPKNPPRFQQLIVHGQSVRLNKLMFTRPVTDPMGFQGALVLRGEYASIEQCLFDDVNIGIQSEKPVYIADNTITRFQQDAIQYCSSGTFIEGNAIGFLKLKEGDDKAHHDCIQGWSGDPKTPFSSKGRFNAEFVLEQVVIHNNHLFDVPGSPLQGIVFFDGKASGWQVTDNNIQLYGPHPLTIRGLMANEQNDINRNKLASGKIELLKARRLVQGNWEYLTA